MKTLVNKTQQQTVSIDMVFSPATVRIWPKEDRKFCLMVLPGKEFFVNVHKDAPLTDSDSVFVASKVVTRASGLRKGAIEPGYLLELWDGNDLAYRSPDYQAELDGQKNGLTSAKKTA